MATKKNEIDIVQFAKKNGAFKRWAPDDESQYIGDSAEEFGDVTFHELMFMDTSGYVDTWSFKTDNRTGEIVPLKEGFNFLLSGFRPDELRKKLAMIDKATNAEYGGKR